MSYGEYYTKIVSDTQRSRVTVTCDVWLWPVLELCSLFVRLSAFFAIIGKREISERIYSVAVHKREEFVYRVYRELWQSPQCEKQRQGRTRGDIRYTHNI